MKNFINSLRADQSVTFIPDFSGIPVTAIHRPWEVGCIITIPRDFQPCMQEMPEGNRLFFVPVEVRFPDGERLCDKLFFGTLFRMVRDLDGHFHRTRGTVVDFIHEFTDMDKAIHGLAGRPFVVTELQVIEQIRPTDGCHIETKVYQFDFVRNYDLAA